MSTSNSNTNDAATATSTSLKADDTSSVVTESTKDMSYHTHNEDSSISSYSLLDDCSQATTSSDGLATESRGDNAAYLREELYGRVQKEPELFEWIQKAALDGIWYWDLENYENEWMSPELKELFGYKDEEVPNTSAWWQEKIFPQDMEKAIDLFNRHVADPEGVPYDSIVRYRHKNGFTVWVRCRGKASFNEEGVPVRMLGAHSDVTRLMEVQEELKKKEAVLDMLCTTALDGFWDWNMKTGEDFLSTRWKKALGYEEEDIENTIQAWKSLLHPDDRKKAKEAARRHMELGENYSVVLRYKRKDGSYAHMLAQGVAQKDDQGEWVRMFGTHTDVSYLEEARQARQASEAKSLFLATMSHEIRTPLNAILGMSGVLQSTNLTAEQKDCVDTLANSGKHLLSLINDILDFSQIEAGLVAITNTQFSIQETVREVVNAMQLGAKAKGIAITFDTSIPPTAKFLSDPERTRQIVFNLAGNAVKFTQQGTVNVSLAQEEKDGLSGVSITVKDTGCGIAKENLPKIFEDFTQADSQIRHRYGGSGLGLSISKKLIAAMGGTIEATSELGKGSSFTVWLPGFMAPPKAALAAAQPGCAKENVWLYEERWGTELEDHDQGSVAKAIRATGRTVVRMQPGDPIAPPQSASSEAPTTIVCALKDSGPQSDQIAEQLLSLKPNLLLDVGRRIDPNLLQPPNQGGPRNTKVQRKSLQAFPTTEELSEAFRQHEPAAAKPQDNKPTLANGFGLGKIGRDMRILVAEDNAINVKVMKKLLSRFPCKVDVAWNGVEAIDKAKNGSKWDLILMDMLMPELDGVDATKAIRKFDPTTPVVALTANCTMEDRERCFAVGMNDFLSKPVNLPALGRVLADISEVVAKEESAPAAKHQQSKGVDAPGDQNKVVSETLEAIAQLVGNPSA